MYNSLKTQALLTTWHRKVLNNFYVFLIAWLSSSGDSGQMPKHNSIITDRRQISLSSILTITAVKVNGTVSSQF